MKKCLLFIFFCLFIFGTNSNLQASVSTKSIPIFCENGEEEYVKIFFDYLKAKKSFDDYYEDIKRLTIDKYIRFIEKYPTSKFVADAMLRIAEFYDLIDQTPLAKKWLYNIIENYPNANYHKLKVYYTCSGDDYIFVEFFQTEEKTAGWALYYRGVWFPGKNNKNRKADFERILKEYKCNERTIRLIQNK